MWPCARSCRPAPPPAAWCACCSARRSAAAVMPATDVRAAAGFWGAAAAVAWSAPAGRHPGRFAGAGLLLACALALTAGADLRDGPGLRLAEALFSSRDGLLFWNPAAWVAIVSWPALYRRHRGWASALFAAAALAVARDQRRAGRGRRTVGRAAVRACAPAARARPGRRRSQAAARAVARRPAVALAAAACALVVWNLLFMELYRGGRVPRDGTVSFPAVAEENAATLARLVGAPPAWPANWVFAWRHGWPVERFDLVVGKTLASLAGRGAGHRHRRPGHRRGPAARGLERPPCLRRRRVPRRGGPRAAGRAPRRRRRRRRRRTVHPRRARRRRGPALRGRQR